MTAMYWQTALLLGLAYFAGCCAACMLRRMLSDAPAARAAVPDVGLATAGMATAARQATPAAALAPAALAPAALTPPARQPASAPVTVARAPAAQPAAVPVRDAFRRADTLEPKTGPSASVATAAAGQARASDFERSLAPASAMKPALSAPIAPVVSIPAPPQPVALPAPAAMQATAAKLDGLSAPIAPTAALASPVLPKYEVTAAPPAPVPAPAVQVPAARPPAAPPAAALAAAPQIAAPQAAATPVAAPPVAAPTPVVVAPVVVAPVAARPVAAPIAAPVSVPVAAAAATAVVAAVAAAAAAARPSSPPTVRVQAPSTPIPAPAAAVVAAPTVAMPAAVAVAPAAVAADDLKRIRAIDAVLETSLNRLGVRRYSEIASWKPDDVSRISRDLGFKERIEQENWIEQAQILARGEETFFSRRLALGEMPSAVAVTDAGERKPLMTAPVAPPSTEQAAPIRSRSGVEAAAAAAAAMAAAAAASRTVPDTPAATLVKPVVTAAERTIAAPVAAAVAAAPPAMPAPATIPAAVSERAAFAARPAAADTTVTVPAAAVASAPVISIARPVAPVSAPTPAAPPPANSSLSTAAAATAVAATVAAATAAAAKVLPAALAATPAVVPTLQTVPTAPVATPAASGATIAAATPTAAQKAAIGAGRDNLQRIGGINAEVEKLLNVQGITRYGQIAHWGKPESERFDRLLGYQGRISRENWIEQAQILGKGGDTAYSREFDRRASESDMKAAEAPRPTRLADAIRGNESKPAEVRPRNDISSLRSVRSEGFRQPAEPARADVNGAARSVRSAVPEDLKRIRGIGVLIEKKLNSMGITNYEQVANWSASDIERVSQVLDFKGRIERENWVEQARILAAGGQTEFSRRADRGDLDPARG